MSATFIQSNVNRPERHDMTVTAVFAGKIVTKSVSMDYDARVSLSDRTLRHRHLHPNDTNSKATRHIVIPRSAKGERGEVNRFKIIGLGCATYVTPSRYAYGKPKKHTFFVDDSIGEEE